MKPPSMSPCNILIGVLLLAVAPGLASAQSLWREGSSASLVSDNRARAVGDVLSIVVQESSTATKDNSTATARKSSTDASISSFLFSPGTSKLLTKGGQLPAMKFSGQNDFSGSGKLNNSEQVTARIAVRVVDVLPNGNLIVEGQRQINIGTEMQDAVLRGTVRAADVTSGNTVFSYQVADATIRLTSKGQLANAQQKGWFTRIWDKVSPF
ncbi:MAG: flagellar basal body L-ring protein FlgH [Limisphaerales bacterium]